MPFHTDTALRQLPALVILVTRGVRLPLVLSLIGACVFVVAFVPWAASRGKFHIPGYGGIAILGGAFGFLLGRLSGARRIAGTFVAAPLAMAFFLLLALAAGCLLALFFYRPSLEE